MNERDVIELLVTVGEWSAGTQGSVVDVDGELITVEIVDATSRETRGLLDAEPAQVRVVWSFAAHRAGEVQDLDCDFAPDRV